MRKQVRDIARRGDIVTIEFIDGTNVVAYQDTRKQRLVIRHYSGHDYDYPDSGFNRIMGMGNYSQTFAVVRSSVVELIFYRKSDAERFGNLT